MNLTKTLLFGIIALFLFHNLQGENQAPEVIIHAADYYGEQNYLLISFEVIDVDDTEVLVDLYYSSDGGNTFILADYAYVIGTDSETLHEVEVAKEIKWLTTGDLAGVDFENLQIRLVANDRNDIPSLVEQITPENLENNMNWIEGIRHYQGNPEHLNAVKDSIESRFLAANLETHRQSFDLGSITAQNIIGKKEGTLSPNDIYIIDGHFDTVSDSPGADDNGSAVAGMLEAARVLSQYQYDKSLEFIGFYLEELGLIGSQNYVESEIAETDSINGVFNFEMIGYYTEEPNTQSVPNGFEILFPNQVAELEANEYRGDFITNIANVASTPLMEAFDENANLYVPELKVVSLAILGNGEISEDTRRSDHASFWDAGYQALMLTDGANLRNPFYHSADDLNSTLDFDFMANVVKATVATIAQLAGLQHTGQAETSLNMVPLGIESPSNNFTKISIAPNPAQDFVTIQLLANAPIEGRLTIYDLNGQIVYDYERVNHTVLPESASELSLKINTKQFSQGLHFVEWSSPLYTEIQKLIILN